MPPQSTSGREFLVRRGDTGRYTYWRILSPQIAKHVSGAICLSWKVEDHVLAGKAAIKISLKTVDPALARARWNEVHTQVEALVKIAKTAAKRAARAVDVLDPDQRAVLSGQARFDVRDDFEQGWNDPAHLNPMARGLEAALQWRNNCIEVPPLLRGLHDYLAQYPRGMGAAEIRQAARASEADQVATMLKRADTALLDGPDSVLEELVTDDTGRAEWRVIEAIPSELTKRLGENGIDLRDQGERRKAAQSVLRAKAGGYSDVAALERGEHVEPAVRPTLLQATSTELLPTLREMHTIWVKRIEPDPKTKRDNELYVERFISMHGNLRVDEIRRKHVRDFRDALVDFPDAMPAHVAKRPFLHIGQWAKDLRAKNEKGKPLSRVTVNKGVGQISILMRLAEDEYEQLTGNPCSRLRLPLRDGDERERHPFHRNHLNKLLSSPAFLNPPNISIAGAEAAGFWMPLISLFSGMRLEEIGQLHLSDIKKDDGIPYFFVRTTGDDDEDIDDADQMNLEAEEPVRSVKTKAGIRRVPIHRSLIEIGLLDYISCRRAAGDNLVFPRLKQYRGRFTKNWSRWWARYQDDHITKHPSFVFHSFRHTFIDALVLARISDKHTKALVGHARGLKLKTDDVTDKYGSMVPVRLLDEDLQKIAYPGVDFLGLAAVAAQLMV